MYRNIKTFFIAAILGIFLITPDLSVAQQGSISGINPPVNPYPNAYELQNSRVEEEIDTSDGIMPPVNPYHYRPIETSEESTTTVERFTFNSVTSEPTTTSSTITTSRQNTSEVVTTPVFNR